MASDNDGSRLIWFLAGAAIGAAVALLYAPVSGRTARKYVRKKVDEGREALVDAGRDLRDRGREFAEEAGELLERGRRLVAG
ncbi:MAG: YtxH domain-containing protein [Bryobacteraceae bacterium]